MIYQVHYCKPSGEKNVELCEAQTPRDALQIVKDKFQNVKILQVTMDVKLYD